MQPSFDADFLRRLADGDALEEAARNVVAESDRKKAENEQFRKANPPPLEGLRTCLALSTFAVSMASFLYVLWQGARGEEPSIWPVAAMAAWFVYIYVPWPKGLPLPHRTGVLDESSRKALLENASNAARNNSRVFETICKSNGYVLFLRSFDPEFSEAWRIEDLRFYLSDEPYRIKEFAPDAEVLLLHELLRRTRIPSVINLLVQVPELRSSMPHGSEVLHLPTANWLEFVLNLAVGAKATIFVISSYRRDGITQELDSLSRMPIPVMAVCEKRLLEDYAEHLPANVLTVTDTRYEYDHTDPPTSPVAIRIKSSVTEEELREYDKRLQQLLVPTAEINGSPQSPRLAQSASRRGR